MKTVESVPDLGPGIRLMFNWFAADVGSPAGRQHIFGQPSLGKNRSGVSPPVAKKLTKDHAIRMIRKLSLRGRRYVFAQLKRQRMTTSSAELRRLLEEARQITDPPKPLLSTQPSLFTVGLGRGFGRGFETTLKPVATGNIVNHPSTLHPLINKDSSDVVAQATTAESHPVPTQPSLFNVGLDSGRGFETTLKPVATGNIVNHSSTLHPLISKDSSDVVAQATTAQATRAETHPVSSPSLKFEGNLDPSLSPRKVQRLLSEGMVCIDEVIGYFAGMDDMDVRDFLPIVPLAIQSRSNVNSVIQALRSVMFAAPLSLTEWRQVDQRLMGEESTSPESLIYKILRCSDRCGQVSMSRGRMYVDDLVTRLMDDIQLEWYNRPPSEILAWIADCKFPFLDLQNFDHCSQHSDEMEKFNPSPYSCLYRTVKSKICLRNLGDSQVVDCLNPRVTGATCGSSEDGIGLRLRSNLQDIFDPPDGYSARAIIMSLPQGPTGIRYMTIRRHGPRNYLLSDGKAVPLGNDLPAGVAEVVIFARDRL